MNKEENKYYTPTKEEFHVGFEFELLNSSDWFFSESEYGWKKIVLDEYLFISKFNLINILSAIRKGWVRVKHLDREDIESLSKTHFEEIKFKYDNNAEPIPPREETIELPDAYYLDDQLTTGELWILYHYKSDGMVWIEYIKDCGGEGYLFKGLIKNKSELKKIMQQVGI